MLITEDVSYATQCIVNEVKRGGMSPTRPSFEAGQNSLLKVAVEVTIDYRSTTGGVYKRSAAERRVSLLCRRPANFERFRLPPNLLYFLYGVSAVSVQHFYSSSIILFYLLGFLFGNVPFCHKSCFF